MPKTPPLMQAVGNATGARLLVPYLKKGTGSRVRILANLILLDRKWTVQVTGSYTWSLVGGVRASMWERVRLSSEDDIPTINKR